MIQRVVALLYKGTELHDLAISKTQSEYQNRNIHPDSQENQ